MATIPVNFRLDQDVKLAMEETCKELGMTMTTAFTIFARKVARERRIPFDVAIDPFVNEEYLAHLRRGIAQLDAGRGVEHGLLPVDD